MSINTIPTRAACLLLAALFALGAPAIGEAQTGYWQYVKTDSYIDLYANMGGNPAKPYPDTYVGGEGALTDTIGTGQQTFRFGGSFAWSRPPAILIPGTALYWPAAATIVQNTGNNPPYLGFFLTANLYPYQSVSDLSNYTPHSSPYLIEISPDSGMSSGNPVGTVVKYNNALQTSPTKIPVGNSTSMDANGQMTILTAVQSSSDFYWSYVYQWVPGTKGTCGGACTLASSGQSVGATGGQGSVNVTASSTWDVIPVDSWITVTSSTTGTGNSSVSFTISPNTGGPRTGTLIIGGQQYTVYQDGAGGSIGTSGGGLGTTNLALNKPVTVNSKYPTVSGTASAITSNPFAAAWFAYQGAPSYCSLVVDLGQTYSLGAIEIDPQQTFDYQLYGSTDGTNYTPIASYTWAAYVSLPVSIAVNGASSARYIKYEGHTPWNQYVGLAGIRVYEWLSSAPAAQPASAYGTTNLALGKTVQNLSGYTSASANPPANVDDGSTSTAWYGTNDTYYKNSSTYDYSFTGGGVLLDLGQSVNLGKIVVTPAKAQAFAMYLTPDTTTPANFVFFSDQTMFTTATTGSTPQTFYIDGRVTARYVWLYAWNLTPGGTAVDAGIDEIAVYAFNGATTTCSGTCTLGAPAQPVAATGGPVSVTVTVTPASTTWTVAPVDSWIQLTTPASNTGNGTATFTVAANISGPRTGAIGIAGVQYTVYQNGTPTGTTAGCSYLIQSSTTQTAPVGGTSSGFIQIVTAQSCAWTASTATSWITINSGATGTGNGAVSYTVAANTGASARSGAILIAGQYVAVVQPAASAIAPGTPVIGTGGVVNTANYASGGPPSGSLAQGSYFSIYGSSLGPSQWAKASDYPLPKTLGGTSVQITAGGNTYDACMVFASAGQINAILPSNVPVGAAQVVVTYNGESSAPATINVTKTNVGVFYQSIDGQNFAIAQNYNSATDMPLNLAAVPAKPGQIVIFWATGMGAITAPDNSAPGAGDMTNVPVSITVGGAPATRLYAGRQPDTAAVDNIYFTVPSGTTPGCYVPVVITAGGLPANNTVIAITADGSPCK